MKLAIVGSSPSCPKPKEILLKRKENKMRSRELIKYCDKRPKRFLLMGQKYFLYARRIEETDLQGEFEFILPFANDSFYFEARNIKEIK